MKPAEVRRKAEALITKGAADYARRAGNPTTTAVATNLRTGAMERRTVRHRSVTREEFSRTYDEARDLILKFGYEKALDPEIQALYEELIPDSEELKRIKRTVLKDLRSRDNTKRYAAAKECCRAGRGIGVTGWDEWPKNPVVVESMIKAIRKETSVKTRSELICALGSLYSRYYADLRIFPTLFDFFQSTDRKLQQMAVTWTSGCPNREKWPVLLELMQSKPASGLLRSILFHIGGDTPVGVKRKVMPLLIETSKRKLGREANTTLQIKMLQITDKRTVEQFKSLIDQEKKLKRDLSKMAKQSELKERQQFLNKNLFKP